MEAFLLWATKKIRLNEKIQCAKVKNTGVTALTVKKRKMLASRKYTTASMRKNGSKIRSIEK